MAQSAVGPKRRLLVPEVVQTSTMDCGPASLKCLLEGFGVSVSYGRLREACQTDVDGTSINVMEDIANQLGLQAEQVMVPPDHVLYSAARTLPAIVVVQMPNNNTHFVVVWSTVGEFVQVMDPATGRRWKTRHSFLNELYIHRMPVPATAWREWTSTDDFLLVLRQRMQQVKLSSATVDSLIKQALDDSEWHSIGRLDASVRLVQTIVRANGIKAGSEAEKLVRSYTTRVEGKAELSVPASFWSVTPYKSPPGEPEPEEEMVVLRGAVLVRILGHGAMAQLSDTAVAPAVHVPALSVITTPLSDRDDDQNEAAEIAEIETAAQITNMPLEIVTPAVIVPVEDRVSASVEPLEEEPERVVPGTEDSPPPRQLSAEVAAALAEPPTSPGRDLVRMLARDGVLTPFAILVALLLASIGIVLEALLLKGLLEISTDLELVMQRTGAVGMMLFFMISILLLDIPISLGIFRMGRRLEAYLRIAFLEKIPRLNDRYFQSRLTSDMAERGHALEEVRNLPLLGLRLLQYCFELVLTTAGIIWLSPSSTLLVLTCAAAAIAFPMLSQPVLNETDMRVRTHVGALSRFYLDTLLGLIPIRAHSAELAVRREHESLLTEWGRASFGRLRMSVLFAAVQSMLQLMLAAWLLISFLQQNGQTGSVLLLTYWVLNLPVIGEGIGRLAQQYPIYRNTTLRLLEPLSAPEDVAANEAAERSLGVESLTEPLYPHQEPAEGGLPGSLTFGVDIRIEDVVVKASGHTILDGLNLHIPGGSQIAIVGPSGAGKSSLVGLLLGWYRPTSGNVWIDDELLTPGRLITLRRETAWVDTAVQLWNRTLLENMRYGSGLDARRAAAGMIEPDDLFTIATSDLQGVLDKLPDGLQTQLGEGGALVSGGEGQRVRLARAILRKQVKLAILDEPFRGLDREQRRTLLARARTIWDGATVICITHDVSETLDFERVLVVENGQVIEDDHPMKLSTDPDSRYRSLLDAEEQVREGLWSGGFWRRLHLGDGSLREGIEAVDRVRR